MLCDFKVVFSPGKFSKRGHFRKNWKSRYFVLELGRLSYYEKEGRNGEGVGYLKSMVLRNAGISHHDDPAMIVIVDKLNRTDLFIKAESVSMAEDWRKVHKVANFFLIPC